jgi:hypothetical protein
MQEQHGESSVDKVLKVLLVGIAANRTVRAGLIWSWGVQVGLGGTVKESAGRGAA